MLHSLVRVSRRAYRRPSAGIMGAQVPKAWGAPTPRPIGRLRLAIKASLYSARAIDAGSAAANSLGRTTPGNTAASCDLPYLPSQQFQALFNSLFKVLFIFPSRYLFAIGLPPVFSLRWNVPPTFCCIPKQQDSPKALRAADHPAPTGLSPTRTPPSRELGHRCPQKTPR